MLRVVYLVVFVFFLSIIVSPFSYASTPALSVVSQEFVSQIVAYDQVIQVGDNYIEAPGDPGEVRNGTSRTGVELYDTRVSGLLNITNIETIGNQTISSINVSLDDTEFIDSWFLIPPTPEYAMLHSSVDMENPGAAPQTHFFIPELRAGDSILIGFNVSDGTYNEPLNFTEVYSGWRVFTGRSVNIDLNVTNRFQQNVPIHSIVIRKTPHFYPADNGGLTSFRYDNLAGEDAANANIFTDSFSRTVIQWEPSGGTLLQNESRQITFDSWAPQNISLDWASEQDWAMWMNMGNLSAEFMILGSISGLQINNVTAVSTAALVSVSKERVNESFYWNATFNITNTALSPLDYELNQVTVWATKMNSYSNPGDFDSLVNDSTLIAPGFGTIHNTTVNATWFPRLNLSSGSTIDNYSIVFDYAYVPIVWMVADFTIFDDGHQIQKLNQSLSRPEDDYLFIEEIYVLFGGYLMKATKALTPLDSVEGHRYLVNITLENIGDENTPELVTMFDLIPKDFNPLSFTAEIPLGSREMTSFANVLRVSDRSGDIDRRVTGSSISDFVLGSQDTGEIGSGPYQGYWGYNIDFSSINAGSDGDGYYTSSLSESEILIRYKIYGNTSLARIENAYIVGVDPIRLEGASPSQSVASRLAIMSSNLELIILVSTLIFSLSMLTITLIVVKSSIEVEK